MEKTEKQVIRLEAKELHKPIRRRFKTRKVTVSEKDDLWVADLVIMSALTPEGDDGFNYILTVMDVLTRYAWARPIKTKSVQEVGEAFLDIFKDGRTPKQIFTDQGKEFKLRENVKSKIRDQEHPLYTTSAPFRKVWLIERLNKTLKNVMWYKATKATLRKKDNPRKWVSRIDKTVKRYNDTVHKGLQVPAQYFVPSNGESADLYEKYRNILTPYMASQPYITTQYLVDILNSQVRRLESQVDKKFLTSGKRRAPKFKVGDWVRIRIYPKDMTKINQPRGFEPGWSSEVYQITKVKDTVYPYMYVTNQPVPKDYPRPITYYEEELQKTESRKKSELPMKKQVIKVQEKKDLPEVKEEEKGKKEVKPGRFRSGLVRKLFPFIKDKAVKEAITRKLKLFEDPYLDKTKGQRGTYLNQEAKKKFQAKEKAYIQEIATKQGLPWPLPMRKR